MLEQLMYGRSERRWGGGLIRQIRGLVLKLGRASVRIQENDWDCLTEKRWREMNSIPRSDAQHCTGSLRPRREGRHTAVASPSDQR